MCIAIVMVTKALLTNRGGAGGGGEQETRSGGIKHAVKRPEDNDKSEQIVLSR
jgi:hypothetical protein